VQPNQREFCGFLERAMGIESHPIILSLTGIRRYHWPDCAADSSDSIRTPKIVVDVTAIGLILPITWRMQFTKLPASCSLLSNY
jgi:hypothetical protein